MSNKIKDLETIADVFKKYGVNFCLVYGALLGAHRDGDFLPGDEDIDLAVVDKIDLETRKAIGWTLYALGFKPQQILFNVFGRMEPSEIGYNGDGETGIIVCERNFKFTIFFFKEEDCATHGKEMLCVPKLGALRLIASPLRFYERFGEIKIAGRKYLTPSPIEEYLAFSYFNNWKDKTDRRHSPTFFEAHPERLEMVNIEGKNQAIIIK